MGTGIINTPNNDPLNVHLINHQLNDSSQACCAQMNAERTPSARQRTVASRYDQKDSGAQWECTGRFFYVSCLQCQFYHLNLFQSLAEKQNVVREANRSESNRSGQSRSFELQWRVRVWEREVKKKILEKKKGSKLFFTWRKISSLAMTKMLNINKSCILSIGEGTTRPLEGTANIKHSKCY